MKCFWCNRDVNKELGALSRLQHKIICTECGVKEVMLNRFAGGVDKRDMPKLHKALMKLPIEIFTYANNTILFVGGDIGFYGKTINLSSFLPFGKQIKSVVYLPPNLWDHGQRKINNIIAHEIAHAYLEHVNNKGTTTKCENEANKLSKSWLNK